MLLSCHYQEMKEKERDHDRCVRLETEIHSPLIIIVCHPGIWTSSQKLRTLLSQNHLLMMELYSLSLYLFSFFFLFFLSLLGRRRWSTFNIEIPLVGQPLVIQQQILVVNRRVIRLLLCQYLSLLYHQEMDERWKGTWSQPLMVQL